MVSETVRSSSALVDKLVRVLKEVKTEKEIYIDIPWILNNLLFVDCSTGYEVLCKVVLRNGLTIEIDKYKTVKIYVRAQVPS